jgi:glycosyltransferase involved in cell wall biosynthesis
MKKISIITPCFNSEAYIADTMHSVLSNNAVKSKKIALQYIICDGNSKDRTVEIAESIFKEYSQSNVTSQIVSENDTGMYDALVKGFKRVNGDICAYINAADLYSPYAFDVVSDLFSRKEKTPRWLTGRAVIYSWEKQQVFNRLPYKYRANLIQCGLYGSVFPHIQQESTFWSIDLLDSLDMDFLRSLKLAGDMYLWNQFSKQEQLYIVATWLGGYRHHEGALSADMDTYTNEVNSFITKPTEADYMQAEDDKRCWDASDDIKAVNNQQFMFYYNRGLGKFE